MWKPEFYCSHNPLLIFKSIFSYNIFLLFFIIDVPLNISNEFIEFYGYKIKGINIEFTADGLNFCSINCPSLLLWKIENEHYFKFIR